MHKTIIFGAIAALIGLAAAAQANDQAKPTMQDGAQITQKADTDGRGEKAEVKKDERAEIGEHDDEHAKGKEGREHESGEREDRD